MKNRQGLYLGMVAIVLLVLLVLMDAFMSKADEEVQTDTRTTIHVSDGVFYTPEPTQEQTPEPPKVVDDFNPIKECTWSKSTQKRLYDICEEWNICFEMCISQAFTESRWNSNAVGDGGLAYGAWQIHPSTWSDELERWGMTANDMYDLDKACEAYCRIMRSHFERYDNIYFALMAWRWGGDDGFEKLVTNGADAYATEVARRSEKYEKRNE